MSHPKLARLSRAGHAVLLAACLGAAPLQAAELGDPAVHSYVGQPVVADIELTGMPDAAVPVQVRLASADVYRGANIGMSPVLSSLNLSVMRRDGRQFLHVTSIRPIEADYLHLFLDLNDGQRRHVRQVTLWFGAEPPRPAPPPPPAAAALSRPAEVPAVEPAAPKRLEAPRALAPAKAVAPTACPQPNAEQLRVCSALDYKNGQLSARIVELEEKVKVLQAAIEASGAPLPAAASAAHTPPPPKKPVRKKAAFPWVLVGGSVIALALAGLLVSVVLRRRKGKGASAEPGPMAKLKSRFKRAKVVEKEEPSVEEPGEG
ncbi:MAG: FimV family protein [Gammaproteobacteria bacterium]